MILSLPCLNPLHLSFLHPDPSVPVILGLSLCCSMSNEPSLPLSPAKSCPLFRTQSIVTSSWRSCRNPLPGQPGHGSRVFPQETSISLVRNLVFYQPRSPWSAGGLACPRPSPLCLCRWPAHHKYSISSSEGMASQLPCDTSRAQEPALQRLCCGTSGKTPLAHVRAHTGELPGTTGVKVSFNWLKSPLCDNAWFCKSVPGFKLQRMI